MLFILIINSLMFVIIIKTALNVQNNGNKKPTD